MKLYTEEQISVAINAAKANPEQAYLIQTMLKPIKLPSDEEIEKWAHNKYHEVEDSRWFEPLQVGAKWMRDTLTNGINNEAEQH